MALGPFKTITDKPIESLISTVPKFHVDLLAKAFIPVAHAANPTAQRQSNSAAIESWAVTREDARTRA